MKHFIYADNAATTKLDKDAFNATGSACDSVNTEVSHVIKAIGVPSEYSEGTIRISFGRDNTEEDAIMIAKALVKVIKG